MRDFWKKFDLRPGTQKEHYEHGPSYVRKEKMAKNEKIYQKDIGGTLKEFPWI